MLSGALIAQGSEEEVIMMTKMADQPWPGVTLDPLNQGDLLLLLCFFYNLLISHSVIVRMSAGLSYRKAT